MVTHRYRESMSVFDTYTQLTIILLLLWGVFDTLTTYIAVWVYDSVSNEANPFVRQLLHSDPVLLVLVKLVSVIFIALILVKGRKYIVTVPYWRAYFSLLCVATGIVVVNNIVIIIYGV